MDNIKDLVDPLFIRRSANGELLDFKHLMSPAETLMNKRILCVSEKLNFTFEDHVEGRGIVDALSETLLALDSISNEPIKLIISSPGGNLIGAFALYDVIKSIDSPVWTFGHLCMSGAALILAAGDKGHRYVYPNSFSMLHLPQVMPTQVAMDTKMQEIITKGFLEQRDRMVALFIECGVKKSAKQLLKDIDRVLLMDANDTVSYGLADKVIRGGLLLEEEWKK